MRRPLRILGAVLVAFGVADCRCIDHPLYDKDANRFDTWYLGGGNSQFRPFRRGELDPDALVEGEIVLAFATEDRVHIRVVLDVSESAEVRGELRGGDRELGELVAVEDDVLELEMDRRTLAATLARHDVDVVLWTEGGGALRASITAADLEAALAEQGEEAR